MAVSAGGDHDGPRTSDGAAALPTALARASIRTVLAAYLDGICRHDWVAVAECFAPTAMLDYGTPGVTAVDANLQLLRAGMDRLTSVSTLLGMQTSVSVDGDSAKSEMAALTAHGPPAGVGGQIRMSVVRYEDWWSKTADARWQITRRICHHEVKGWCDPA
jgi:hypothetical protein